MRIPLEVEMFNLPNFMRVKAIVGDSNGIDVGALFPNDVDAMEFWDECRDKWVQHVKKRRNALGKGDAHEKG
jgi:hypothetical protein